jgi:hypothetical protein
MRITSPGSVRCAVASVTYAPSGLHDSDPALVLARKLTGRPSPGFSADDAPSATAATCTLLNVLAPALTYAMKRESGDHAKSRESANGGVSKTPVAISFSTAVPDDDAVTSIARSSRESRSNASHLPSGEKRGMSSRPRPDVTGVSVAAPKS